jgi:murein L,D-transpeptidase YafK
MAGSDDKIRRGDKRTPEGEFRLCGRNARSEYHRFIEIGYPNGEDAERGFREGLISKEEHNRILAALAAGNAPPYDTALGGEVGIHGLPVSCSDATLHQDTTAAGNWSFGCIVVLNRDIESLWDKITIGDRIFIFRE